MQSFVRKNMEKLYMGEYSINKMGRSMKVSIPPDVINTWKLADKDKVHLYFDKGYLVISDKIIPDNVGIKIQKVED